VIEDTLSLAALNTERVALLQRAEALKADLAEVEASIANLNRLIQAFEEYTGRSVTVTVPPITASVSRREDGAQSSGGQSSGIVRSPSTDRVGALLARASQPLTREQIREAYRDTYGFPSGWSNPANALNNAIARAARRGLIREISDGVYTGRVGEFSSGDGTGE